MAQYRVFSLMIMCTAFAVLSGCSSDEIAPDDANATADTPPPSAGDNELPASEEPEVPAPQLQFDGMYQGGDSGDSRKYIRFYDDGTVMTVTSTGDAATVERWFKKENIESKRLSHGRYEMDGDAIAFSSTSEQGTVDYEGTLAGDTLTLDVHSQINDHRSTLTFSFVPLSGE